jgi:hypothetical protein
MQVIIALVPSMKELTKDAVGQHTVQQYTRYLMFAIAVVQSFLTASELRQFYVAGISPLGYYWTIVPIFVLGLVRPGVALRRDDGLLVWAKDPACSSPCPCAARIGTPPSTTPQPYSRRRSSRSFRSSAPGWRSSREVCWSRLARARCRCCTFRVRRSRVCRGWFERTWITSRSRLIRWACSPCWWRCSCARGWCG